MQETRESSIASARELTDMDEILLEGMRFFGYHGVNPEETSLGQRFVIDLAITADLRVAGKSDRLEDSVNYSAAFKRVRAIVEEQRFQLIEALGSAIALDILINFPAALTATVTVRKPGAAITGSILDAATVRIQRNRSDLET